MRKETRYASDARQNILNGIKKIVAAIKVTLGAAGRNVVISQSMVIDYGVHSFPVHITKDGVTVAKAFDLEDPLEKPGVLLVKEACQKTVDQCGDGTTSCAVLLEAIVTEGIKMIEQGANPMELKMEIDVAVEKVVSGLKDISIPIKGDIEKIRQIATVSANNDQSIGNLITEAFERIGYEGDIDIEQSNSTKTEVKISDGFKINRGWISPYFVNNKEKQICEFENPLILLYDKRVIHHTQIEKAMQISMSTGRPALIICEDADEEGLAFLNMNIVKGTIRCCAIKAPEFGDLRREQMEDIAVLTGANYMSDLKGLDIKKIQQNDFGSAKKVIITKDETIIIGGESNKNELQDLLNELRINLAQAENEEEKRPIEKRIARLTGGIAVIQVGAATETEMKERLDRFDDAVRATKSAIAEGFVAGGGITFMKIDSGNELVNKALKSPFLQICRNAGIEPPEIRPCENVGYNAKTNKIENLIDAGVIDPAKVLRCSLQNAASAAGMVLTCEAEICDSL